MSTEAQRPSGEQPPAPATDAAPLPPRPSAPPPAGGAGDVRSAPTTPLRRRTAVPRPLPAQSRTAAAALPAPSREPAGPADAPRGGPAAPGAARPAPPAAAPGSAPVPVSSAPSPGATRVPPAPAAPTSAAEAPRPAGPAEAPRPAAPAAPCGPRPPGPAPASPPPPPAAPPRRTTPPAAATAPPAPWAPPAAAPAPGHAPVPAPRPADPPPAPWAPPAGHPQPAPRPAGAADPAPWPGAPRPPTYAWPPPETPAEQTTRLRPVPSRRPGRTAAAVACVVLGLGLLGGAAAGTWLTGESGPEAARRDAYAGVRELWHNRPVDTLFPPTLKGDDAGPGGADRVWNRIAVAPDTDCAAALDPLLATALRPVGCERVVRATYSDATASSVTTVGMVFTEADGEAMLALHNRFTTEGLGKRRDLMPRTLPAEGTVAEGFGSGQRASWTVRIETDAPVVVFAVSGFADGRTVEDPRPATEATEAGATSTAAQAGLGHDAQGIAERIGGRLRTATTAPATEKDG